MQSAYLSSEARDKLRTPCEVWLILGRTCARRPQACKCDEKNLIAEVERHSRERERWGLGRISNGGDKREEVRKFCLKFGRPRDAPVRCPALPVRPHCLRGPSLIYLARSYLLK